VEFIDNDTMKITDDYNGSVQLTIDEFKLLKKEVSKHVKQVVSDAEK